MPTCTVSLLSLSLFNLVIDKEEDKQTSYRWACLTLIHGYKKTYKFTGGGVRTDPKYKAVLFKKYEKQEITLRCWFWDSDNNRIHTWGIFMGSARTPHTWMRVKTQPSQMTSPLVN